jgi:sodium/proline symporter
MNGETLYTFIGVAIYLAILVAIGVVASRKMKDIRDYFAAGKNLGFLAVAFSARATGESAWLLLGLTGMGAALGVKAFWVVFGEVLGVAIAWLFMSRRFKRLTDRYDAITVPDYLEARFRDAGHTIRLLSAFALVVFVTIYVSAQIDATGKAFEDFLQWDYFVGAGVGFAVVLAYITTGGFVAVAWSDVFQGTLMLLGLVVLPLVGLVAVGGWGEVSTSLGAVDPCALADAATSCPGALMDPAGAEGWTLIGVFSILSLALIGLGFLGSPQIFVRFLALKSEDEISRGTWVAISWTVLADSGAVLVGLIGRVLLDGQDLGVGGENVLPMLVDHLMPAFLVGLYIAIVLAAIMSTVDSLLVLAGSAAVRDVYQKVMRPDIPDDALVAMSRTVTFVLALIGFAIAMAVAISTPDRTIFWFVIFGWSGIAATFCPTLILSLFWRRFTGRGAIAAMVTGFLAVPFFKFGATALEGVGPFFAALSELPPAFCASFLVGVFVSLADRQGAAKMKDVHAELDAASR